MHLIVLTLRFFRMSQRRLMSIVTLTGVGKEEQSGGTVDWPFISCTLDTGQYFLNDRPRPSFLRHT